MKTSQQAPEELLSAWTLARDVDDATVRAGRTDPAEMVEWARAERANGVALPYLEGEAEYRGL